MKQYHTYTLLLTVLIPIISSISAEERTINVNGTIREYIIEVPANYSGSVRHDLIIVYHGMSGTASQTMFTGFHNSGAQDHFITIYPQGLDDIDNPFNPGTTTTGWKFEIANNRDVTFTEVLLDTLEAEFNLRHDGIYITGISNGGYFSDILACNIGDRLAAIAPVIGGYQWLTSSACAVSQNLPIFHLGTEFDAVVDIENLRGATEFWIGHNNCDDTPVQQGICDVYSGSENDAVVYHCEFECLVNGVPVTEKNTACHTWPASYTGYSFEATEMILDFFREYGLGSNTSILNAPDIVIHDYVYNSLSHETRVQFHLSGTHRISLALYNLSGRKVMQVINNKLMKPGNHSVVVDNEGLSKGAYIVRFQVNNGLYNKKILIIR